MSFKWQVPLGTAIGIPCRRDEYKIGLSSLVLYDIPNHRENSLLYVCINPFTDQSAVWLGNNQLINAVATVVRPPNTTTLEITFFKDQITFHDIDLRHSVCNFRVYILNSHGSNIPVSGLALFEVLSTDNC